MFKLLFWHFRCLLNENLSFKTSPFQDQEGQILNCRICPERCEPKIFLENDQTLIVHAVQAVGQAID